MQRKVNKDGTPRKKPGPKPRKKPPLSTFTKLENDAIKLTPEAAMQRCSEVYGDTAADYLRMVGFEKFEDLSPDEAKTMHACASSQYRLAMPVLKPENVKCYIACVAQGVSLEVFNGREASQLLYAAQVMTGAARNL